MKEEGWVAWVPILNLKADEDKYIFDERYWALQRINSYEKTEEKKEKEEMRRSQVKELMVELKLMVKRG